MKLGLNSKQFYNFNDKKLKFQVQIGGQEYEKQIFDLRHESDKQKLQEILKRQHGRMVVNYLGQ